MPRSRSGSRPSSRPVSMISTLALSPTIMSLGEKLITTITGFEDGEENFDLCRDFLVSNLLYHNCLDPHERDVEKRFQGIQEKWLVNADRARSEKLGKLLTRFNNAPVFGEAHEQGDIRVRLLSLLLNLSNSKSGTSDNQDSNDDEGLSLSRADVLDIQEEQRKKAELIRKLLQDGEEKWVPSGASDLSDWSSSSDEVENIDDDSYQTRNQSRTKSEKYSKDVFLPGCKEPLKPPVPVSSLPGKYINEDVYKAEKWLHENVLPPYWVKETDGRNKFPLKVDSKNSSAHILKKLENFHNERGMPLDCTVKVSEYQILRECLWMFRNPLCETSPIFRFDSAEKKFLANGDICIPSMSQEGLTNLMSTLCNALGDLHRIYGFISYVFDRRLDDNINNFRDDRSPLPPFTYEAYAEGLTNLLELFSADLLTIENTVHQGLKTFTLMDLQQQLISWFEVVGRISYFHKTFVDDPRTRSATYNWQKSMILIASLNSYLSAVYKPEEFSIFVELYLRTITPYFRIISVWITQGRLEDWRNEFVLAANPKLTGRSVKRKLNEDETVSLEESFWAEGFITHPFEDTLEKFHLEVPQMFAKTLPRILTCGKSIEILTRLQKEGVVSSSEMSLQELPSSSKFYEDFLKNLKSSLSRIQTSENLEPDKPDIDNSSQDEVKFQPSELLSQYVQNVDDLDSDLVAAFETMLSGDATVAEEDPEESLLVVKDDFLILDGYSLDPMKPITNKLESSLAPVVQSHTHHACCRLVHLFRQTLELEQHLNAVRRVFLLEAGDLLSTFSTEVFARLEALQLSDNGSPLSEKRSEYLLDSLTLTLFLHDCLGRRSNFGDSIYRFMVDLNSDALDQLSQRSKKVQMIDCLVVKYSVDWPLCIVLHNNSLKKYNKILVFLLKVKQALWNLQRIQAKDLIKAVATIPRKDSDQSNTDESNTEEANPDRAENLSDDLKIHRILLLKSWLLHFVGSVHSYFMTRVVHSTEMELKSDLCDASDLDAIVAAHEKYVERIFDRCFLHPSASILKDVVLKVFRICSELYNECNQFVDERLGGSDGESDDQVHKKPQKGFIKVQKLVKLEEDYARSHQFLASTLSAMTQKRNVPHLEGLAASIVHSCPSVAVI